MNEPPDPHALETRRSGDPGEDMNVRQVHAAIWREEAEPAEVIRRTPSPLQHLYLIMFLWLIFYLINWTGGWRWDEYEASLEQQRLRNRARADAAAPQSQP